MLKYSFIVLRADDNGQGARPAKTLRTTWHASWARVFSQGVMRNLIGMRYALELIQWPCTCITSKAPSGLAVPKGFHVTGRQR